MLYPEVEARGIDRLTERMGLRSRGRNRPIIVLVLATISAAATTRENECEQGHDETPVPAVRRHGITSGREDYRKCREPTACAAGSHRKASQNYLAVPAGLLALGLPPPQPTRETTLRATTRAHRIRFIVVTPR